MPLKGVGELTRTVLKQIGAFIGFEAFGMAQNPDN